MTKKEFLNTLRKRLYVLEDSEIEDIISEYEGYIEEKVKAGSTEKEAVKELGNINEIVNDLLAVYKVKNDQEKLSFNNIINKIGTVIDNFISSLNNKSGKDILKIIVEIILILFFISLLKIPFLIIEELGSSIFENLFNPIGTIFNVIWHIIIEIIYTIISIIFFVKMLEKRYFENVSNKICFKAPKEKNNNIENNTTKNENINENSPTTPKKENITSNNITYTLLSICLIFLKCFAIIFLIGVIFYLIGISVVLGFMIYLISKGITYYGFLILILALFIGGTFFLELIVSFIFNKKIKAFSTISKLITTIILLGVGLAFSAIEISDTEIIYENYSPTKTITKELAMSDDLKIYDYTELIVDETLKDTIKIEYRYPDIEDNINLKINLIPCNNGYCLDYNVNHFKINHQLIDTFINNLKKHQIYIYNYQVDRIIYGTSANLNKIKDKTYYDNDYDYEEFNSYNFTKTYLINSVTDIDDNYYYLTISSFEIDDAPVTVKVPIALNSTIKVNKYYEFTFEVFNKIPDDNIKDIFDNTRIIKIVETNKKDHHQIQDSPYHHYE